MLEIGPEQTEAYRFHKESLESFGDEVVAVLLGPTLMAMGVTDNPHTERFNDYEANHLILIFPNGWVLTDN